jgi:hypothetical protein
LFGVGGEGGFEERCASGLGELAKAKRFTLWRSSHKGLHTSDRVMANHPHYCLSLAASWSSRWSVRRKETQHTDVTAKTIKVLVLLANSHILFEHVQFLRPSGKFFGGSNTQVMGPFNLVDDSQ